MGASQGTKDQHEPATHIILACDESGSKGYSDRDEAIPGETGVFAGIMVSNEMLKTVIPAFNAVVQKYKSEDGKMHITDLPTERQHALREAMFALIREHQLPCFYEAIHVAGFHQAYQEQIELEKRSKDKQRSGIKSGSRGTVPSSMHVALFQGLYSKIIAFCLERNKLYLHIEVRTDRVDSPLVRNFEQVARELLNFGATIEHVTGFDPVSKSVVKGTVETSSASTGHDIPVIVENLEFNVVNDNDGLVVAADVLANSINYLFRSRQEEELFRALNTPEAFSHHPLRDNLDSFRRWDGFNFTDTFYAHPNDPNNI